MHTNCVFLTLISIVLKSVYASSPVVIVPGIAGSQLWAFPQNPSKRWQIWVSLDEIYIRRMIVENLKLDYDYAKRMPVDNNGLGTGPGYYGDPRSIEYLDDSMGFAGAYMYYIVEELVKLDPFYVRNQTIRAAPFDFRFTPREKPEMISNMKALVEETYAIGNNQKVTIIGHSLGGVNSVIFLQQMTKSWREKYVKQFISISGVYGGSVKSLKGQISGDSINLPLMWASSLRPLLRTMSGLSSIIPNPELFGDKPVILTDHGNYTAHQYKELYTALDSIASYEMWVDNEKMYRDATAPPDDVKTICIYGYDVPTMNVLDYRGGKFPDKHPDMVYGPGDGTVSLSSLQLCHEWHDVEVHGLDKAEHFEIVSDRRLLSTLMTNV